MALNLVALGVALQNQGGSGGTVFTELTVTENGVYDKPAIIGEPVFEVGEKLTFKSEIVLDVDFPKTIFDEFGPYVFFFDGQYIRPEGGRLSYQDCMLRRAVNLSTGEVVGFFIMLTVIAENCEFLGYSGMGTYIYFDTYTAGTKALEPGWYKDDDGVYTKLDASPYIMLGERTSFGQRNQEYNRALFAMKGVFEGLSSPADGWNKVTVNVPGDIIDVTEFPTSGIDQDKVYRLTTAGESVTEIWHSISPDIIEGLGLSGILEPLTRNDVYIKTLAALDGGDVEVEYELHVVNTLPDVGVPSVPGQSFHVYVVNDESSEAFCFMDGSGWVPGSALDFGSYLGTVDDMADVKEAPEYMAAYYILKETRAGSTSYGIPNEDDTKKIYEHDGDGWIELGEGGSFSAEENEAGGLTYEVSVGEVNPLEALFEDASTELKINLPNVVTLRSFAFRDCTIPITEFKAPNLKTIKHGAFLQCIPLQITELPDSVEVIENNAFMYDYNTPLKKLPSNLQRVGQHGFRQCSSMTIKEIPASVRQLSDGAFSVCTSLTEITFKGTPKSNGVWNTAFSDCKNLTTINVPWAEGAVTGAPWGAKNATINYNYTEEG